MLVVAVGGYKQVREIFSKLAVLFAFFATFFHAKIAMAVEASKDKITQVQNMNRISNVDPWKIVDVKDDAWKNSNDEISETTTTTSTSVPNNISSSTSTSTVPTSTQDQWQQSELETTTSTSVPSTTLPSTNANSEQQVNVEAPAVQTSTETKHTVVRGENLYSIAKLYAKDNISINKLWVKIITVNKSNLASKNPNLIYAGETIIIPQI